MKKITTKKTKLKLALVAAMASLFVPTQSYALDLVASSVIPSIGFVDVDIAAGTNFDTWSLTGDSELFQLQDINADVNGPNTHTVMSITGASGSDLNENSLIIDGAGDIKLASDSVFIERSTGRVGIGTVIPESTFHVNQSGAQVLVTDNSPTINTRTLFRVINNGGPNFSFQDTSNGIGWQFAQTLNGDMSISKEFSGGPEFIVQQSGRVRMGPGAVTNFDLRDNGNLIIPNGSVTANGILLTSSRATKTDISEVNSSVVMEKLKKMELAEWRYKKADKNDRHISPMAEDFYSLFNLGPSNKHINPNDLASVALIAAKELQKQASLATNETGELKRQFKLETIKFKAENESLKARLASLEKLVTNLAMGSGTLSNAGKIALK